MWVYIEIEPDGPGHRAEFVRGEKKVRRDIIYDATCRSISRSFPEAEGLVVPDSLGSGYNYDVRQLILQLRLEIASGLQELPILVRFDDDDRYLRFYDRFGMMEEGLKDIGVVLSPPDRRPESMTPNPPQPDAVRRYIERYAARLEREGRHSQANQWGPYVFFRVLESLDRSFATQRESIETRMFAEPYLKRLAGELRDEAITKELVDRLRFERDSFRKTFRSRVIGRKILVVEDRLDDGWREVYEVLFDSADPGISVVWATTVDEARAAFEKDVGLVILDVRLDPKDEETASSDDVVPTGVTLARWFREKWSPIPILAATASNKTWILEPLLKEGIQGYWVKESPEQAGNLAHAVRNVMDLYRKAREILEWSDRTRPWIQGLYAIAEEVSKSDVRQGMILEGKAKSLHALLDRAFSPFSRDLDGGLQLNVAFLILFSCMNDLRAWCCRVEEKDDGGMEWITAEELGNELLVTKRRHGSQRGRPKFEYEVEGSGLRSELFPDTDASIRLLTKLGYAKKGTLFRNLKNKIRNALPLTHGVTDAETGQGAMVQIVTDDRINEMLDVLRTVVEKRRLARSDTE